MYRFAKTAALPALAFALTAVPALAQDDEPAATREPDANDVAMTPLTDLNLSKDEIPQVLLIAAADPYASDGLKSCEQIGGAIAELDAVLGPDMDVMADDRDRISWGRVATSAVGSFIPFRSVLRELTGAADHKRDFAAAIYAGAVRRGFLKGLGQQKGCAYPARPAFERVTFVAERKREDPTPNEGDVTFVSEPVVQPTPKRGTRRK
jgi:hypothetical protein